MNLANGTSDWRTHPVLPTKRSLTQRFSTSTNRSRYGGSSPSAFFVNRTVGSFEELLGQTDRAIAYRDGVQKFLFLADALLADSNRKFMPVEAADNGLGCGCPR